MRKNVLTFLFFCFSVSLAVAQNGLPENPDPGKCYISCITPDVWETKEVKVLVKPAYTKLEVVPAVYKDVEEKIMIKPATKKFVYHPATFKTVEETIKVEDPYNSLKVLPASFDASTETIEVRPANAGWQYQTSLANCKSDDPRDCMVMCYVEEDAEMKTIPTEKLANDASTTKTEKGGKTMTIKKEVLVKEAYVETIEIPAEFKTIKKKVLVSDETTKSVKVDAVYETETVQVLKEKGGRNVWEEIDCELTNYNVLPIFYELGSARLTAASKKVIDDKIYQLMKEKPLIRVELGSHTDSRGTAASNMSLSQKRAQSVVDYLVAKGISKDRLIARGYGETRLVNRCADGVQCSEKEHLANRRTEFRVLSN